MWQAPTARQLRKKRQDQFYLLLSQRLNFMDETTVMEFYLSMMSVILDELRRNKIVTLPLLGELKLKKQSQRMALVGRSNVLIGPRDVLKFCATDDLKKYFANIQGPVVILNSSVYREAGRSKDVAQ